MIVDAIRATQRDQAARRAAGEMVSRRAWWEYFLDSQLFMMDEEEGAAIHSPLSPSSIGGITSDRKCSRQHAYRLLDAPRDPWTPRFEAVMRDGIIHEASILADIQILSSWKIHSRQVQLKTPDGQWGYADAIATPPFAEYGLGKEVLIECKSINSRRYNHMLNIKEHGESHDLILERDVDQWRYADQHHTPDEGYVVQVMRLLEGARFVSEIDTAVLIFKNKDTGSLAEFIIRYDENFTAGIRARVAELKGYQDGRVLPPRDFEIGRDWQCSYCSFRTACEDSLAKRVASALPPALEGADADDMRAFLAAKGQVANAERAKKKAESALRVRVKQNAGAERFTLDGQAYEFGATTIKKSKGEEE
jgi:hypothetical protein